MQDVHQIQVITKALEKEKDNYLHELAKINTSLSKKIMLVEKMTVYLSEYHREDKLSITKKNPVLLINLEHFSKQIEDVISKTNNEINLLKQSRNNFLEKITTSDQKIKLMNVLEEKINLEKITKANKIEQAISDDLAALKSTRGAYE